MTTKLRTNRTRWLSSFAAALAVSVLASTSHATSMNVGNRSFERLCPTHVGGDREFNGNGPDVTTVIYFKKGPNTGSMLLETHVEWLETKRDSTKATYFNQFNLGNPPAGKAFTHVWAADENGSFAWKPWNTEYFDVYVKQYRDTNHAADIVYPSASPDVSPDRAWWLDKVEWKGDTKGNDVGACTSDDAYMSLFLPAIWLWY